MWLLDLVGGGGFVRVSVTARFEGVAEVVVISTVGIDERVLVNWSCSLVKTKSVGYELGGVVIRYCVRYRVPEPYP